MIKAMRTMIALCLAVVIVLSMPLTAFAGVMDDIRGHWAEDMIRYTVGKGILKGYPDGTFRPENPMTQAEFITLINRSFGFNETAELKLSTVSSADWYAADFKKAKAQGYLEVIEDSMIMPKEPISRQMVSAMLGKVLKLKPDEDIANGYRDAGSFAAWAKGLSGAVSGYGYMKGYNDNTFRPETDISRAEVSTILYRAVGELYDKAGVYGDAQNITRIKGNVTVASPNITLRNMVIEGNLYLTEGIGEGAAELNGVTVLGTVTISGGGGGISLKDTVFEKVIISSSNGLKVHVIAKGKSKLGMVEVQSGARLEELDLTGAGFGEVELSAANSEAVELAGDFDRIGINGDLSKISILRGTTKLLEINGKDTLVEVDKSVRVDILTVNKPARVIGKCYVGIANINSNNVYIEARPMKVNIAAGLTGVTCIAAVTASSSGGGGGGGGGAGGGSSTTVKVTSVDKLSDINVNNGTAIGNIGLPAKVKVTLDNNTTPYYAVTWDGGTPAYDANTAGKYVFSGTLKIPSGVASTSLKASIKVIVANATVNSIDAIADISVVNGTALGNVVLPTTVKVTLNNGTTPELGVTWDGGTPAYNGSVAGTYVFSGTLTIPTGVEVTTLKASVKVIVKAPVITVTSVDSIADITVDNGTALGSIGLPATAKVALSNGTTPIYNVTWDGGTPAYNESAAGTYVFSGTLTIPTGVEATTLKASVKVIVKAPAAITVTSVDPIADIPVDNGTVLGNIGLPTTAKVTLSDGTTPNYDVTWDGGTPTYDANTAETYVFSGTLTIPTGVEATTLKASVKVIVGEPVPTGTYAISTINIMSQGMRVTITNLSDANYFNVYRISSAALVNADNAPVAISNSLNTFNGVYNDPANLEIWVYSDSTGSNKIAEFTLSGNTTSGTLTLKETDPVTITVTSVDPIADITVDNGTVLGSIGLPTTAKVTLSDGTTPSYNVTWDGGTPTYGANTAGTYVFSGTLTIPTGVEATALKASVKVIVKAPAAITVTSVDSIADITVDNGTVLGSIGLPTTAKVTLSDGTNPSYNVTWDGGTPAYDANTAGTYVFSGTLTIPTGVEATVLKASVKVIVGKPVPTGTYTISAINIMSQGMRVTIKNLSDANYFNVYRISNAALVNPDNAPVAISDSLNTFTGVYNDPANLEIWVYSDSTGSNKIAEFTLSGNTTSGTLALK